ncbi:hypothetical protein [Mycobacterium leprae]|nr:hypothetical protein [Mycobacterium leprae]
MKAGAVLLKQSTIGKRIYVVSEDRFEIMCELANGGKDFVNMTGPE